MRCISTLVALFLLTGTATAASTDELVADLMFKPRTVIYVGGGLSIPITPSGFKDGWDLGWTIGGGAGYRFSRRTEIRALVLYNTFGSDTSGAPGVSGGDLTALQIMAEYKILLNDIDSQGPVAGYALVGFGFGQAKVGEITLPAPEDPVPSATETTFAINLGAGIDVVAAKRVAFFLEGRYSIITTVGGTTGYIPIVLGARFPIGG